MRKFLALAAMVLGLASCQTEPEGLDVNMGDGTTTISVVLPEEAITRAGGTDSAASGLDNVSDEIVRVVMHIYDENGNVSEKRYVDYLSEGETTVNFDVRLVPNRQYTFVAWADQVDDKADVDKYFDTQNLANVTLKDWAAMDEGRDAFTATHTEANYTSSSNITLKLTRPFAKLRVVTTDMAELGYLGITPATAEFAYTVNVPTSFNALTGEIGATSEKKNFTYDIADYTADAANTKTLFSDYLFVPTDGVVKFTLKTNEADGSTIKENAFTTDIPVKRNNLTTLKGNILTDGGNIEVIVDKEFGGKTDYNADDNTITEYVDTAEEFEDAFNGDTDTIILDGDINLDDLMTRAAADKTWTVDNGRELTIDLNGHTLSATNTRTATHNDFILVKGVMNVKNGTITIEHTGTNMGWNGCTHIFDITAGGVLNLDGVTAKNLGGTDMNFAVHMNNWGEVTLNADNCTFEATYVAVRVNNSGPNMNNVTIKNSTLKGVSASFWVHNYTAADFGSEEKAAAQQALLNLNIFGQGNTFSPDVNGVRFGFNDSIRTDAYGITKEVSEDGTVVTLGSNVEDGIIRRYVAGAEENNVVKKVVVGEGVTVLYDRTFRRYYALEEVILPSTLTTIGAAGTGVFQACTSLQNIVIPESVTVLGKGTFYECSSLQSINIPAGVTRIEENCLRATALVSVEFHEGVTYFGAQAFRDCKQLKEVYILAPEFTIEPNAFGVMAGTLPGTTIYVANAEMKAYLESTLTYAYQFNIVAAATESEEIAEVLANGENVVMANDLNDVNVDTKAPYGNYYGFALNGGVLNGNGHTLDFDLGELHANKCDNYGIMTTGGTIKNVTIEGVFRGIMIMNPTEDLYIDNVKIGHDDDMCYGINTGDGDGTHSVIVTNSTLKGWNSFGTAIKDLTFKNCTFGQGTYYTNVFGRLVKPYVDAVFENCEFNSRFYIDLSQLGMDGDGHVVNPNAKIILKNCTVNGTELTADNWTSLVVSEDACGEGQISIELKDGSYMTADNIVDYVIFE